jgi:hypothetical protein
MTVGSARHSFCARRPAAVARGRAFRAGPVRHPPLELVVELDRQRDERVREQRR